MFVVSNFVSHYGASEISSEIVSELGESPDYLAKFL